MRGTENTDVSGPQAFPSTARMSRIYLNGRFLSQPITGVQRFAVQIVRAIDRILLTRQQQHEFILLKPHNATHCINLDNIRVVTHGKLQGVLWEQLELPIAARDGALLNLGSTGPGLHKKQIVTMHDANVFRIPNNFSFGFRSWYRFMMPLLGRKAKTILTVSEFSRQELTECAAIPPEKIAVVWNAASHILESAADTSVVDALGLPKQGYVLCAGTTIANKNLQLVVQAMEHLKHLRVPVVTYGRADIGVFARSQLRTLGQTVNAGIVTDAQLRALYENAACFVFPSLYEGFGIPPLEAMLCQCPVIAADSGALPETCGAAALYCNAYDALDLAAQIEKLLTDPQLASCLVEAGSRHAAGYSWDKCAAAVLDEVDALTCQAAS